MLDIKNLTITHKKDFRGLIKNFSFSLNKGDKAVVIGEEGNGKSTLLKLIHVKDYVEFSGRIHKNVIRTGYLSQELSDIQKELCISKFFSLIPSFIETTPKEQADIGYTLGISPDIFYSGQKAGTLSGGEKVKVQLAAILMDKPDVLLLEEPSNDIDIETLEWLERFLISSTVPVLFVSHDETLIEKTANIIIHIEQVRHKTLPRLTVARMPYTQYVKERLSIIAHQSQMANKEQSEYEKQQEKFRQIRSKVEHQQAAISRTDPHGGRLLKKKMKSVRSMGRRFEKQHENMTQPPDPEDIIMINFDKSIGIQNGKTILDLSMEELRIGDRLLSKNIKLNVTGPEKVCIIGRNSAGKTTLIKIIADLLLERKDIKASYIP